MTHTSVKREYCYYRYFIQVKLIESIESMDKEGYDAYFSEERVWTTVLSDGSTVPLKPDGADLSVRYEDRLEYCAIVKKLRMTEADKQVCLTQPYV